MSKQRIAIVSVSVLAIIVAPAIFIFNMSLPDVPSQEWWDDCPLDQICSTTAPQSTYTPQYTHTPDPTPTCRPTTTCPPASTALPTSTLLPTSTAWPTQPYTSTAMPALTPTPTPTAPATPVSGEVRAFPSAEGFGANSIGGHGGRVIEVTNLNNSGPGSLRAAIEANGPRIVVFRIGGTIELQSGMNLTNPFITIAGQTAPGGGITLKNAISNRYTPITIWTHDVIIRYIRSRPGASRDPASALDAIQMVYENAYNIILDHCSFSWSTDEVASTWGSARDITIQWCIIAEGLNDSTNKKGPHSCGLILGSDGAHSISVHHNLLAHHSDRSPRIKTGGLVDFVNNVIYNPGAQAGLFSAGSLINYVGNYVVAGADTDTYEVKAYAPTYVLGNIGPHRPTNDLPESFIVRSDLRYNLVDTRFDAPAVITQSALLAHDYILADAGANAGIDCTGVFYERRDTVDARIVNDVINGTGSIIDDPSEVGGWPALAAGTPCTDADHDGMPDEWENIHGFDPNDDADGPADTDGDGYTNIEEYLNGTEPND